MVEVAPRFYLVHALLPAILAVSGPALLLGLATFWHVPATWVELFAYGIAYSLCYFLVAAVALLGVERLRLLGGWYRKRTPDPVSEAPVMLADTLVENKSESGSAFPPSSDARQPLKR